MRAAPRRFAGLVLSVSVAAASAGLVAPAQAAPVDDVTITESDDQVAYVDESLTNAPTDTVRGTLRVSFVERRNADGSPDVEVDFAIVTASGQSVPIELAEDLPTAAANGAIEAEVVDDGSAAVQVAEATVEIEPTEPSPRTTGGTHRAYVALVAKTGVLPSEESVRSELGPHVLDEWVTESEGAISDFPIAAVKTLARSSTTQSSAALCAMAEPDRVWDAAERLFPGVSFDQKSGNHLIVINSDGCRYLVDEVGIGVGTVGSSINDGGAISLAWDNAVVRSAAVHEIGHNFGLLHANAKACGSCASREYFDVFSVMGFSIDSREPQALDTPFRDLLRIAQSGEVQTITASTADRSTRVTLEPRGASSGLRGLKIVDPISNETFWIENRGGGSADRDANSAYSRTFVDSGFRFAPGVTVSRRSADRSLDLYTHPRGGVEHGSLQSGQSWTAPSSGLTVTVETARQGGPAVIVVAFDPAARGRFEAPTPSIRGTRQVGSTVTALYGTWTPTPSTYTYQWYAGSTVIAGATSKSFMISNSLRGRQLRVKITGSKARYVTRSVTSPLTSVIAGRTFRAPTPSIRGTRKVGSTLTALHGTWSPTPTTYRYQWYVGSSAVSGQTGKTYRPGASRAGKKIRVKITGSRSGYVTATKYSPYTASIKR